MVAAHLGTGPLDRRLDVMGIMIQSSNDDNVLKTSSNEQFAIVQKPEIASPQKWSCTRIVRQAATKRRFRLGWLLPITRGYTGTCDPDLSDPAGGARPPRVG